MVLAYVKKEALIRKSETKKEKKMRKWIDMHCDTLSELLSAETLEENSLCVDRKRMEQTKMLAEFFACFVCVPDGKWEEAYQKVIEMIARMERGVYRIHQFEKQEMIVVCKPEDSKMWFEKLWNNTVDLFRSLDIPVRTLECCSGDLADLKSKSIDVEAWSPRQKKYFEVGSCSNLTDAQARRLNIRINGENGKYFAHTLNNTVVAPPRMLIAFLENNLNEDGSVNIPKALQPYMGGKEKITK